MNEQSFYKEYDNKTYYCAVDLGFHLIGGKWKGVILWNLRNGSMRFSDLRRALVVINDRMLSKVLRELEHDGLVIRKDFETVPPHVEYSLSDSGTLLLPILENLESWSREVTS